MFEQYKHFGKMIWCFSHLKGKHKEHCLCHSCKKLNTEDRDKNCWKANIIYSIDCGLTMVTPVFECLDFEEKNVND